MKPRDILCPVCESPCGKEYPAVGPSYDSGGEPGYRDGKGEDFSVNGVWHCSEACLGQRKVTVCASCLQASCWHGAFFCENYKDAGTKEMTVQELRELNLESSDYWTK